MHESVAKLVRGLSKGMPLGNLASRLTGLGTDDVYSLVDTLHNINCAVCIENGIVGLVERSLPNYKNLIRQDVTPNTADFAAENFPSQEPEKGAVYSVITPDEFVARVSYVPYFIKGAKRIVLHTGLLEKEQLTVNNYWANRRYAEILLPCLKKAGDAAVTFVYLNVKRVQLGKILALEDGTAFSVVGNQIVSVECDAFDELDLGGYDENYSKLKFLFGLNLPSLSADAAIALGSFLSMINSRYQKDSKKR